MVRRGCERLLEEMGFVAADLQWVTLLEGEGERPNWGMTGVKVQQNIHAYCRTTLDYGQDVRESLRSLVLQPQGFWTWNERLCHHMFVLSSFPSFRVQHSFISIPQEKWLKREYISTLVQLGRAKTDLGVALSHTGPQMCRGGGSNKGDLRRKI